MAGRAYNTVLLSSTHENEKTEYKGRYVYIELSVWNCEVSPLHVINTAMQKNHYFVREIYIYNLSKGY